MFPYKEFQNPHHIDFRGLAELWQISYEKWNNIPAAGESAENLG